MITVLRNYIFVLSLHNSGKEYRPQWKKEKRNEIIRSLFFDPDLHEESIIEGILEETICPLSDSIAQLQAPRHAFQWIVTHTKYPYIGIHLHRIFPPVLQLLSSHNDDNRIIAIRCLDHIIDNISRLELKIYNYDKVIMKEFTHHLTNENVNVLKQVLPCTLKLLAMTATPPYKSAELWKPNPYDMYLLNFLDAMAMENKHERKALYVQTLDKIVERCGFGIIKHLKSIITILLDYLKFEDTQYEDRSRIFCVRCLQTLLQHAWQRMPAHSIDLVICAVSIACSNNSSSTKLFKECKEFVKMLRKVCNGSIEKHIEFLRTHHTQKGVKELLDSDEDYEEAYI